MLRPHGSVFALRMFSLLFVAAGGLAVSSVALADAADAHIPPPRDVAYSGTVALEVDASDTRQGIFRVHETIPVQPGPLTLLYPKWLPGAHSPVNKVDMLAGLRISAGGKRLAWHRVRYDVYAFRVEVPAGITRLDLEFQLLSGRGRGDSFVQMTDKMLSLDWNAVALYPAGYYTRGIVVAPRVKLPTGWEFGTALEVEARSGDEVSFKPTPFNTLVDSPVYAGRYFKRVDLTPAGKAPVHVDMFADAPKYLGMTPRQVELHRGLIQQVLKLFGSHHYHHYDFLMALSRHLQPDGLEHHQSVAGAWPLTYFSHWDANAANRDIVAHEYIHSWNGKFRRPRDLWTPNFNLPMDGSLLWVYEGQTQYWGFVVTARAGLWTPEQFRGALAMVAANYDVNRPGFRWRTLADTTNDPVAAERGALPYRSWQMSEDYYSGGQLMWLAADAKIRALSHGSKSLDAFARKFFGVDDGSLVTRTYTRADVIAALNSVVAYDWAGFLHRYVDELEPPFEAGLEAAGWKLVYTDEPSAYERQYEGASESSRHMYNFTWSIGMTLGGDGTINDVRWDGPAFRAGVGSGGRVVSVNGKAYTTVVFEDAIRAARKDRGPIELAIEYQGETRTVPVTYHDGLKYPHLVRIPGTPDYLSQIITPRK